MSNASATAVTQQISTPTLLGHPRGLAVLFFAEMWERFSYYGMRGLLILYLTKHWLFSDAMASGIYASYASLVYLTPVLGGLIADRFLGFRRAVIVGGLLLCCGHLGMAIEGDPAYLEGGALVQDESALQIFYLSLAFIIVGVGLLKPSISSTVGQLYGAQDGRRDAGFTIFYMGINLGSVLAALTCGYLGEVYGWAYGFGLAGLGMVVGLITFVGGQRWLQAAPDRIGLAERDHAASDSSGTTRSDATNMEGELDPHAVGAAPPESRRFGLPSTTWVYVGTLVTIAVCWVLMQRHWLVGGLLSVASILVVLGIVLYMFRSCTPLERRKMGLLVFLTAYSVIFWALFEQAGSSMNLFADRNVDRVVGDIQIATAQLQFFNPGFIILLAPLFSSLWQMLASRGMEPSSTAKFGMGVAQAGLGFLVLVYGITLADSTGQVAMLWLALAYLLHTTGELCLSPVGLSMVTRLAVAKVAGLMMGVWFLASSVAHYVAGIIAAVAAVEGGGDALSADSLIVYRDTFYVVGLVGTVAGFGLLLFAPWITRFAAVVADEKGS